MFRRYVYLYYYYYTPNNYYQVIFVIIIVASAASVWQLNVSLPNVGKPTHDSDMFNEQF